MLDWLTKHGTLPSSYDWSRTHATRRGGIALMRLRDGHWPSANVVGQLFGSWQEAREAAGRKREHAGLRDVMRPLV